MGGKVQAPAGYADHVVFTDPALCRACQTRLCIEMCSGQALMPGEDGVPAFDREKCIHCGACYWNCTRPQPGEPEPDEPRVPRRRRRAALDGELMSWYVEDGDTSLSQPFHIVVCGSVVPDPLQTLEPV